jgi:hypothetical protein
VQPPFDEIENVDKQSYHSAHKVKGGFMATRIECDKGHRDWRGCRINAREISQHGMQSCSHCGEKKHYIVSHYYPYDKIQVEWEVISVYALFSATRAEREGWDPMIFLMKNRNSNERMVWPYYWTKNRHGKWANGQFPPLLKLGQLRRALNKFGAKS